MEKLAPDDSFHSGRSRLSWLYVFLIVSLIALIFASQAVLTSLRESDQPITLKQSVLWQLEWWYLWLLLAPLILRLAQRFPIDRAHRLRHLLIHIPSAIFFVLAQVTLFAAVSRITEPDMRIHPFLDSVIKIALYELNFQLGIIFYAVLISIASAMNYYRIYQAQELTASRLQAQLAQTKFESLKVQIYPHFLFNTLNAICNLMKENIETADKMIARLGDFLRLTMENIGIQEVALQRELVFLRCYLEIESIRLQNKLTYDADVDPDSLGAQIPNLLLQPLVESILPESISSNSSAHIQLRTRRKNGNLEVQIQEQGESAADLRLRAGLDQTQSRLQQLYGETCRFDFAADPNGSFTVTLEIPFTAD